LYRRLLFDIADQQAATDGGKLCQELVAALEARVAGETARAGS